MILCRSKEVVGRQNTAMGFCSLVAQDGGIFVLTMATTDGHQYLNDEAITELVDKLSTVRKNPELRGLVTTSKIGSFCDGIDYDNNPEEQAAHLAQGMAEVIRLLLEMPVPTAAAVAGNATSLGLALALAHDHCVVWDYAVVMLPEAQRGRPLPEYASALLRDKVAHARLRKLLMLKSQRCTGKELASTWYSAHCANSDRAALVNSAWEVLEGVEVGKGTDFAKARQIMWPESCAAVGVATLPPRPRPSPQELQSEKAKQDPGKIFDKQNKPALQRGSGNAIYTLSSVNIIPMPLTYRCLRINSI
ncbi:enoyl-CoA delta isomerase 2, peroxisomal-like [Phragmites australis]|uniref:enoyl-CoA delta isomerase 2, peroxisomal-like n=1 Tax=Phragmites australis TaxID=29695 RepID=UPI002D794E8A|nr:enoyl-CoA delta isomerase 2, peroxisomal-like [Phragmites australis]